MFSSIARAARLQRGPARLFSSSATRSYDVAKLILVGRLGREAELRTTSNNKEYVTYTVATTNYPPPPANPDGSRPAAKTSWHHVISFSPSTFEFLRGLPKGSHVYVEANYELRDADPTAEADSPQAQRQIFLRHESIRLIRAPSTGADKTETDLD